MHSIDENMFVLLEIERLKEVQLGFARLELPAICNGPTSSVLNSVSIIKFDCISIY
jgi:hypothetical protein